MAFNYSKLDKLKKDELYNEDNNTEATFDSSRLSGVPKHELYSENNAFQDNRQLRQKQNERTNESSIANQILKGTGFVAKKTGLGVAQGITGIGQAQMTEIASSANKGKNKNFFNLASNSIKSILGLSNPMQFTNNLIKSMPSYIKDTVENIKDKNKTGLEKVINQGLNANTNVINSLPVKQMIDSNSKILGKINPNTSKALMSVNDKIQAPINKANERLAKESQNYGNITNLIGNAGQSVGNMAPSIATSILTQSPTIGLATMGLSAKGQSTQEALSKGADLEEAIKIGNAKGMIEVGTEMLTGGVNIFGKGALDDIVERGILNKVKNNIAKFFVKQGINASGEVLEETISDIAGTLIDKGTVNPNATYSLNDWKDTAITTILTTAVLNTLTGGMAGDISQIKQENQANKNAQEWIDKAKGIIAENQDNKLIDQQTKTAQNGLSQEQNTDNNQSIKNTKYKKYDVKEIPEKNGTAFQVDSDIMDVVGHIPNNGDMPFIDQIFYSSKVSEDSYNEQSIPKEYLRKGNATNHVLSALEYFKKKGINEFQVKTMNENSNALMESLVRKGYVEQLSDYKYLGDDVTYKISNQNNNNNQEQVRIDSENFAKQIDQIKKGTFPKNDMIKLGNTPQVLKDIGLQDLPITMTQKHLDTIMNESGKYKNANYHGLGEDIVKQLPEAINNPLDIVKSNTKDDSIVLTTYLADKQDRPVIASIKIDGKGTINDIRIDTNVMTSAYGRNNYDRFMQDNIKNGNLLYDIDQGIKKKVTGARLQLPRRSDFTINDRLQLPIVDSNTSNNIISQNSQNMQEKSENEINPYRNTAKANKLIKEKNEKIRQLNSNLKQVTSEEARKSLQNEINNLEKDYNDRIQKLYDEVNNTTQNSTSQNDSDSKNPTRHEVIEKNRELARENIKNIANWKDKKNGLSYQLETMERNMYDIIQDKEEAKKINDTYFEPIHKAEAEKQKFINKYNAQIKELDLNKYESEAVQFLGEKKYNPSFSQGDSESIAKRNEVQARIDKNIENGKIDKNKVNNAIETFRNIYDELFDAENNALRENGYKEKPYRKGYFPHFIDYVPETKTEKVLNALGFKIDKRPLPTDIAGITEQFVPGKTWNRSALERKSNKTDYNALKGFDTYISQAADNIFHTDNIQKLRGLENEIRYQYSDKGIQNRIDEILNNDVLYEDEKQDLINQIFDQVDNPMPNLVTELRRYTNALANKKSEADRSAENKYGRAIYNTVNAIENRFGANAVGLNIGSAVTNFIPITQAYSQVSTKNMTRATIDTVKSYLNDDGFAEKSAFLTSRLNQSEKLYKTTLEKISDKTSFLFNAIDDVTSNIVVRGKYLENIQNGMSESEAIKNADQFARNVIADRSKGALPTKFEEKNPITKMLSQFQLEVNNQYRYMFKDIPRDLADKGLGSIAMAFFKMFVAAWLYNKASEKITGRKPAFSPIDLAVSTYNTFTNDNLKTYDKIAKTANEMGEQLPFVGGLVGGGRVPVNGALPNVSNLTKAGVGLATGEMDSKKAANTIGKELSKPLYYLLPPFGGAQIKKTVEGIKTVKNGGSYGVDNKGEETLQFPVESATVKDYVKAGVFGKYALPLAKDYTDSGYKSLNAKQTKIYKESNLPYKELLQYIDQGLKTNEDKINYISSQKMNEQQKWGIYKYDIFSSTERDDGGSQLKDAEYITLHGVSKTDYINLYNKAQKNDIDMPTADEYKEMKSKNISLNTYINYKTSIKEQLNAKKKSGELDEKGQLKDKDKIDVLLNGDYTNTEKKIIYENYIGKEDKLYNSAIKNSKMNITEYLNYKAKESNDEFVSDKDEDGKSISGSSKKKYYDYVNKNITGYGNRLLILGSKYKLSDTERKALAEYINKNYSKKDLIAVYEGLNNNFTIKDGKIYYK